MKLSMDMDVCASNNWRFLCSFPIGRGFHISVPNKLQYPAPRESKTSFYSIWLKRLFSAILSGLMNTHTLCRPLYILAVLLLVFSFYSVVFAEDTYCTCINDTCGSGACDYKGCAAAFPGRSLVVCNTPIWLLQPLDNSSAPISATGGQPFQAFSTYFTRSWPWVIGSAAGIAVLQALVGSIQIMMSGSDSGMRDAGKSRLLWALAGLLLIGLSGLILEIINPIFYHQV